MNEGIIGERTIKEYTELFYDDLGAFLKATDELLLKKSVNKSDKVVKEMIQKSLSPWYSKFYITSFEYELNFLPLELKLYLYIDALKFSPYLDEMSRLLHNCCAILLELGEDRLWETALYLYTLIEQVIYEGVRVRDCRLLNNIIRIPTVLDYNISRRSPHITIEYKNSMKKINIYKEGFEEKYKYNKQHFEKINNGKQYNKNVSLYIKYEQDFWRGVKQLKKMKSRNTDVVTIFTLIFMSYYHNIFYLTEEIIKTFTNFLNTNRGLYFDDILKKNKKGLIELELNTKGIDIEIESSGISNNKFNNQLSCFINKVGSIGYSKAITSNKELPQMVNELFVNYYKNNFTINESREISFLPLELRLYIYINLISASDRLITITHLLNRICITLNKMQNKELLVEAVSLYTKAEICVKKEMLDSPEEIIDNILVGSQSYNERLKENINIFNSVYALRAEGLKEGLLDLDNIYNQEFWYGLKALSNKANINNLEVAKFSIQLFSSYFDRIFLATSEFKEALEEYYDFGNSRKLNELLILNELDQIDLKFNKYFYKY